LQLAISAWLWRIDAIVKFLVWEVGISGITVVGSCWHGSISMQGDEVRLGVWV